MSNILTYEYVKNFIEVESNSDCKLLSTEYITSKDKLNILCSCGKGIINETFRNFKFRNKRLCSDCFNSKYINNFVNVQNVIKELNYELLSNDYKNLNSKLLLKTKAGYIGITQAGNLLRNKNIEIFHKKNPYTIINIKLWLELNNKTYKILSNVFIDAKSNLLWKCSNCNSEFTNPWYVMKSGNGCPYCEGARVNQTNCLAILRPDLAEEWHPTLNGDLTPYDVTCGKRKYVWWICKECGHEWEARIRSRNNKTGCPECKRKYKLEEAIVRFLNTYNFMFIRQYKFPDCKYKRLLSFDFYLPKYNICIEAQGMQHYKPIKYFGGEETFKLQQIRDCIKYDYCKSNNIKLLCIPYTQFNVIEDLLKQELNDIMIVS